MGKYSEILSLPRPRSQIRQPMAPEERAAQFAPFAALSGYDAAIDETARAAAGRSESSGGIQPVKQPVKRKGQKTAQNRQYVAIDLKSFYASVECADRELDPMTTNLVVADISRTEKTICLAVSPALKAYGIPGRARLFEVMQKVREINQRRLRNAPEHIFSGSSSDSVFLDQDPSLKLDLVIAPPQMARYMEVSTQIYQIYLRYIAPEDIHVYSIDEVFIDVTAYLATYGMTPRELAMRMIRDVLDETGITATVGIGTNLYLSKIAMDIVAKKMPADEDGVRIAELDEQSYRRLLWEHKPLTDFWRVGRGYARKLEANYMFTMGDIALCSLQNEELLYKLFGVNAELLIDHAWGYEPVTIDRIKCYRPQSSSLSSGQVLSTPYTFEKGKLIVREMTELLVLDLVDKGLLTDQMVLTVGYDIQNLTDANRRRDYQGEIVTDHYGRNVPKQAHGSVNLEGFTSSTRKIMEAVMGLYDRIVDPSLLVRRMYVVANHTMYEADVKQPEFEQLELFADYAAKEKESEELERERRLQETMLSLQKRYGKNAVLKGMNLEEGATTIERNGTIGGHKA